jgi:AraC family transcriptional regulator
MQPLGAIDVEGRLSAPAATVQLVHYRFAEPPDSVLESDGTFRLELCLSGRHRSTRGRFPDAWSPQRFERIGDLFVLPPDMDLAARSDDAAPLTSILCQLKSEIVLELFDPVPALTDWHLVSSLDIRDRKIRALMLRLAEEMRQPGFASEMLVDLIARQMAIEMFRLGGTIAEPQVRGALAAWQLKRIDERLDETGKAPALSELAALCRLSVRQLTRAFRASRGCSLGAHVTSSQMNHAKRLLTMDESVTSIAHALGFSSSSNFCVAFRRATGMTPGQFRALRSRH